MLVIALCPTVTFAEVGISCNKEVFDALKIWNIVKPYTTEINDSRVLVSLTRADITAAINGNKKGATSAEILATICTYQMMTEEKLPFINIDLSGEISVKDFVTIDNSLRGVEKARSDSKRRGTVFVNLNSTGGDIFAAMKIGRQLANYQNVNTSIQPEAICASACVLILAAGESKSIFGKVGIHRLRFVDSKTPNLESDEYRKTYDAAMQEVIEYLKQMGIRTSLADDMMRYTSDDVHFLGEEEIENYGLNQRNPYSFEQEKAQLIARCGEKWYALMLQLDEVASTKCAGLDSAEQAYDCIDSVYGPLYKICK